MHDATATIQRRTPNPLDTLTDEQIATFGAEMDALRDEIVADLGQADVDYMRTVIKVQRRLEVAGRGLLWAGWFPPAWLAGTAALSVAKILDNMEIGHNVMHGQYDWTGDPDLAGNDFEWDTACPADQWRHSHNYLHHTFTNIEGKDRDLGYGVLRITEDQRWTRWDLTNPIKAALLAVFFQYGVGAHDLEVERLGKGRTWADIQPLLKGFGRKTGRQALKDYVLFPALSGPGFVCTLAGNATANLARNLWAFTIIFCGHFPAGVASFPLSELDDDRPGRWYARQLLGSANIEGGHLFHIMSGNLSHQIEHHLFPTIPAARYPEMAPRVQAACERAGLPYNTGGLAKQFGSVVAKICRLALPPKR
jgi:linoleoyl-CoA desaturase